MTIDWQLLNFPIQIIFHTIRSLSNPRFSYCKEVLVGMLYLLLQYALPFLIKKI